MRIVHLSDFHLDKNNQKRSEDLVHFLCQSLVEVNNEKTIDLIIFTGDAINKGGQSYNSVKLGLQEFEKIFVDSICESIGLSKERFVFTIGNHDINREADSSYAEDGLKTRLVTKEALEQFWDDKNSDRDMNRVHEFKEYEKDFYSRYHDKENFESTRFQTNIKVKIGDNLIGITCLNSAWRCYDSNEDQGRILMGERQISDSLCYIDDCNIKIAISHHHYSWVRSFEMVNLERLLTTNYSMYFCGHTHSPGASCYKKPEGVTFVFVAPGILSANINENSNQYQNGYGVIDYDDIQGRIDSRIFLQQNVKNFNLDLNFGFQGVWSNDIPLGEEAQLKKELQEVILNIKEQADSLNEHLLSYHTKTSAPKSLKEMFVMPKLTLYIKDEYSDEVKNEIITDLDYFVNTNENYMIFGTKESGKTVLLDKLLTVFIEKYSEKHILPIKIEFKDLKKGINSAFKDYMHLRKNKAEKLFETENVILLIDDIDLEDDSSKLLTFFGKYLEKNSNIRFIGTCRESLNHEPFFHRDYMNLFDFRRVEIGAMGAKEMMELSYKWNKQQNKFNLGTDLSKVFMNINIPRTPFSVSMFLWILERQSGFKPQNVALLIDMYIEELLKTGNPNKDSSEKEFDFIHKKTLLSYIANCMRNSTYDNYSYKHSVVLGMVEDYLEKLEFKKLYNASTILDSFINLGLFVNENGFLRFRFRCFYEFFLSVWMEEDPTFLITVKEDILKYHQVIQYYTGLNRSKKDILIYVFEKLKEDFKKIEEDVAEELNNPDMSFQVEKSIVGEIGKNNPERLMAPKMTDEEKNDQTDAIFSLQDRHANQTDIKLESTSSDYSRHLGYLSLAMNVLKNLESIREGNLKSDYYKYIIKAVLCHAIYVKKLVINEISNHVETKNRIDELNFFLRFFPSFYCDALSQNLGSYKICEIVEKKIESDFSYKYQVSEFEKFLSVFLYYDIKATNRLIFLKKFISEFKQLYIADACYIQLMKYYMNSTNPETDKSIVDLLAELIIKMTPMQRTNRFGSLNEKRMNDVRKQTIIKKLENGRRFGTGIDLKRIVSDL